MTGACMTPDRRQSGLPRAGLYVLGLAWLVPFLVPYHRYPITAFYGEWLALALGLAAASMLLRAEAWRDAQIPAVALAPLGLALLVGLQVAQGLVTYAEQALVAALYLAWAALLVVLGRALRRELGLAPVADTLAWFLLAGGVANALAALSQLYDAAGALAFLVADRAGPAVYGNLHQQNHFAAYGTMALASAGYLFGRGRFNGTAAAACLPLLVLMLAASGSRSTWLYLAAHGGLAALWHRRRRDAASRRLLLYALLLLPAFALAQWAATLPFLRPAGEMVTSAQRLFELATGIAPRWLLAREAWLTFLEAPWTGAGWGQFAWQHFLHLAATGPGVLPGVCNHAHNIVLQLLAETGVAGAALFAGAAALCLFDSFRADAGLEWWWLLALLAVLGIHSLLEFPLWYAYFLGMAALLAGLASGRVLRVRRAGAARAVVALFVLSGALHLAAVLAPYREFERLVFDPERRAAQSMTDENFAAALARLRREPVLAPYVELAVALGMEASDERLAEKLDVNTRAMHFAPAFPLALRQAMLLALTGDAAAAARQLERVARAYPDGRDETVRELAAAALRHPAAFTPLLELAAAGRAQPGGVGAPEDDARRR